jgi:membrane protease YdiL (CAAX protease family)
MNPSISSAGIVYKPGRPSHDAPFFPHRAVSTRTAVWSLLLGVALVCPAILLMALFPITLKTHQSTLKSISQPGFVILTSIIIGPLLEEVIYRGLFLQLARRYTTAWKAIILSSAIFAVTHFMKGAGVTLLGFAMGCLFAWMVVRSGSLYPGFLCHAGFNLAAVAAGSVFDINNKILAHPPSSTFNHPLTELFPAWWIVLSIVMVATSFTMLARESGRCEIAAGAGTKLKEKSA